MAKKSLEDYGWTFNADAFNPYDESFANKLSGLQQTISKLGMRKVRYADAIRQSLREGQLKEREINTGLQGQLKNLLERMAAKGLAKSGATAMLGSELEKEAAVARKKAVAATASAISSAQNQISQLADDQKLNEAEIQRLLKQASRKYEVK